MDPRHSHEIVAEMITFYKPPSMMVMATQQPVLRTRPGGRPYEAAKRHDTYFPSKASFDNKWNFSDDDESTWEFSAPVPVRSIARSFSTGTCSSASSSAAQEIALRFRAGMSLDAVLTGSASPSVSSVESNSASWDTPLDRTFDDLPPPVPEKNERFAVCASPDLPDSFQEAMESMKHDGKSKEDQLVCHRPGCHDVVRNVEALMYHLQIHDVHDE
ncbi:hypothetical protein DXG01_012069 [Tephrocybe rancida]|nr:hypothetical protein DXG01_012069 [Tephrocybe rancida]